MVRSRLSEAPESEESRPRVLLVGSNRDNTKDGHAAKKLSAHSWESPWGNKFAADMRAAFSGWLDIDPSFFVLDCRKPVSKTMKALRANLEAHHSALMAR